jgi:phenylalanine-4-hydroxylase
LRDTAHPAYRGGLAAAGISVDRIPRIDDVNEALSRIGWAAVCVDGFIPPRAFQEFQAASILPIAAEIRSFEHLAYTPAPDVIHEAAGHAPILSDPAFSAYLRRMGEIGRCAFTFPEEHRVYQAIHDLSELKEDPAASKDEVARGEAALDAALAAAPGPSEATLLSRLYWWTAEYGLVGTIDDYKLYGAGLLSSLGESHSCRGADVRKVPLDERCVDMAYDITRPQPVLFVVRHFEQLHDVLDRVERTLAWSIGGAVALNRAVASRELSSVQFACGAWAVGQLREVGAQGFEPAWLDFEGAAVITWDGDAKEQGPAPLAVSELCVLTGRLSDGASWHQASVQELEPWIVPATGRHCFRFATGACLEGRLDRMARQTDGRLLYADMSDVRITLPSGVVRNVAHHVLLPAGDVRTARAGSIDPRCSGGARRAVRSPKPRLLPARSRELLGCYESALHAHAAGGPIMREAFADIHRVLRRDFPDEWLLRWNLLESLMKAGDAGVLASLLREELEELEVRFGHREPIASGLRYLMGRAA